MRPELSVSFLISIVVALAMGGCGGSVMPGNNGGGPTTTVTFTFDSAGAMPAVVATRIGSGAFAPATLSSNVLTLSIPEGTTDFAVAYLCPTYPYFSGGIQYGYNDQYVVEAGTGDGTSFTESCPSTNLGTISFEVDDTTISGAQGDLIETGNESRSFYCDSGGLALLEEQTCVAPFGSNTAFVEAHSGSVPSGNFSALAVRRFDAQTVSGSLNAGEVMLGSADLTTGTAVLTNQNLPSGFAPNVFVYFDTSTAGDLRLAFSTGTFLTSYPQLPAAAMESGDFYSVEAQAWNGDSAVGETVGTNGGGATVQYPSPWSYSGPAAAALPVFDFSSYTGFVDTGGLDRHARITWSNSSLVVNNYRVSATANAMNGSTLVAFPDLSGVSGFLANPAPGSNVDWLAEVEDYSAGAMAPETAGTTRSWVENEGSFVVP